jgi:hypothetical protein
LRHGPFEILVDRESAIQQQSTVPYIIPINRDHSNMVKFTEGSVDYDVITRKLREVTSDMKLDSPQNVSATGADMGEQSAFEPWRLFSSFSRSYIWKQKPKAATISNPGMLQLL